MAIWKPISGSPGYEVSDDGRVRSTDRVGQHPIYGDMILKGKELRGKLQKRYRHVQLCVGGRAQNRAIHRLVAEAFIPNPDNLFEVNHIDGNQENNVVANLEWTSRQGNARHAADTLLRWRGENNPNTRLTLAAVKFVRSSRCDDMGTCELAEIFGVAPSVISNIRNRRTWTHV